MPHLHSRLFALPTKTEFSHSAEQWQRKQQYNLQEYNAHKKICSIYQHYAHYVPENEAETYNPAFESIRCKGDDLLDEINYKLDHIPNIVRNEQQIAFCETYVHGMLPFIFGADWPIHAERILRSLGLKEIFRYIITILARRGGKTWSVAMVCAVVPLVVSGLEFTIFSTSTRVSQLLMKVVVDMLALFPESKGRWFKNAEQLYINVLNCTQKRPVSGKSILNFYPSVLTHSIYATEHDRIQPSHALLMYVVVEFKRYIQTYISIHAHLLFVVDRSIHPSSFFPSREQLNKSQ